MAMSCGTYGHRPCGCHFLDVRKGGVWGGEMKRHGRSAGQRYRLPELRQEANRHVRQGGEDHEIDQPAQHLLAAVAAEQAVDLTLVAALDGVLEAEFVAALGVVEGLLLGHVAVQGDTA